MGGQASAWVHEVPASYCVISRIRIPPSADIHSRSRLCTTQPKPYGVNWSKGLDVRLEPPEQRRSRVPIAGQLTFEPGGLHYLAAPRTEVRAEPSDLTGIIPYLDAMGNASHPEMQDSCRRR